MENTTAHKDACPVVPVEKPLPVSVAPRSVEDIVPVEKAVEASPIPNEQPASPKQVITAKAEPIPAASVAENSKEKQPEDFVYDFTKWKELPPPIKDHLTKTWGNWLNHIEVFQEWRNDFGGYALMIRVPKPYSTFWEEVEYDIYNNDTRKRTGSKKVWKEDVRTVSMVAIPKTIRWLDLAKDNIIKNAQQKGIWLPNMNVGVGNNQVSFEEYKKQLAGTV